MARGIFAVRVLDCGYVEEKSFGRHAAFDLEMWCVLES